MNSYVKLGIASLLPVIVAMMFYIADKYTKFKKLNGKLKQVVYGVVFGALAIIGTEWGIPLSDAQVNCRDGAVLIAGLLFGGPAGVLAGLIGGVERFVAVLWGVGRFTQIACSFSTIFAGFFAYGVRYFLCDNKKPSWSLALATGVVVEVFHMTMVFITNMAQAEKAMSVVKVCAIPMIVANSLAVMLAALVLSLLARRQQTKRASQVKISQTIQRWLLVTVAIAFFATSYFVYSMQDTLAHEQADSNLKNVLSDVADDIADASDRNMIEVAREVIADLYVHNMPLDEIAQTRNITEINVVDKHNIITQSTNPSFVNYNMTLEAQSAEFSYWINDWGVEEFVQEYGPIGADSNIYRKYAGKKTDDGYVQVGYDAKDIQKLVSGQLADIANNRHIGKTGFIVVAEQNGNLISSPKRFEREELQQELKDFSLSPSETTFTANINNKDSYCRVSTVEGYTVLAVLPLEEALQMRNVALYVNAFMEILVFAVMFVLIFLLIKRVVVNQIKTINNSLDKITGGDLDEVVNVRSSEEFASLSDDINSTVDTLKHYIAEASARIDAELEFAKNIQTSVLPNVFPAFPKRNDFDIYALMNTAKEVGGDFYDFYLTDQNKLNFVIADVSGKGIPAAMFMMRAKTELKSLTEAELPISEVFTNGNNALCEGNDAGMFVTAWQCGINLDNGIVTYANAGHNPPIVKRADGSCEYLRTRADFVLAGMEDVPYSAQTLQLQKGDVLFLYTDGVTEATNANNVLYGEQQLLKVISLFDATTGSMNDLCNAVKADVDAFVGEAPQFDDITMVAFKYNGAKEIPTYEIENAHIEDVSAVTEFVENELAKLDCPLKKQMQIDVAIDEIFSNIVTHGYKEKGGRVVVKVQPQDAPKGVSITFVDECEPYNPLTREDPDLTLSLEDRKIGGLGIYMVKKTMDDVTYKYENQQNILTIKCLFE